MSDDKPDKVNFVMRGGHWYCNWCYYPLSLLQSTEKTCPGCRLPAGPALDA